MAWDQGLDKNGVAYKIAAADEDRIRAIAEPGTGKSYAMKRWVARLLEEDASPEKVLAVTFTGWHHLARAAASLIPRPGRSSGLPHGADLPRGQVWKLFQGTIVKV